MAMETSPQAPAPVRQIANAIAGWVERLGAVWVEGQVAQVGRRPGLNTVFLTLRDPIADISVPVTCSPACVERWSTCSRTRSFAWPAACCAFSCAWPATS